MDAILSSSRLSFHFLPAVGVVVLAGVAFLISGAKVSAVVTKQRFLLSAVALIIILFSGLLIRSHYPTSFQRLRVVEGALNQYRSLNFLQLLLLTVELLSMLLFLPQQTPITPASLLIISLSRAPLGTAICQHLQLQHARVS
jgi:hypothetical protein